LAVTVPGIAAPHVALEADMKRFLVVVAIFFAVAANGQAQPVQTAKFMRAVMSLENPGVAYDNQYRKIGYPGGDVPANVGVCSDVAIRAYRGVGIDLQRLVHEDMQKNFAAYPKLWGLGGTDKNVDHRRVPNLRTFFGRHGTVLKISRDARDYRPGDIVTWNLRQSGSLPHIGIVTGRISPANGRPLVMHNIGGGQVLEDVLFAYTITGHYRYALD
jgi:uncharacterized protein